MVDEQMPVLPRDNPEATRRRREIVGRRVQQLRIRRGWNQQDLAAQAHVNAATVKGLETGTMRTQWDSLMRIATALGTDADILTADTENDLALAWLHPQLRDLLPDDFEIAHLYHGATAPTREYVRYLLKQDHSSATLPCPPATALQIATRLAATSARFQEAIAQLLREHEQHQQRTTEPEASTA